MSGRDSALDESTRAASQARREALFAAADAGAVWSWEAEDTAALTEARQELVRVLGEVQVSWPDAVLVSDAVAQRRLLRALGAYRDARVRQERAAARAGSRVVSGAGTSVAGREEGRPRTWRGIPLWLIGVIVVGDLVILAVVVWFVLG